MKHVAGQFTFQSPRSCWLSVMKRFPFRFKSRCFLFKMKVLGERSPLVTFCHLFVGRDFETTKGQMSQQCGPKAEL